MKDISSQPSQCCDKTCICIILLRVFQQTYGFFFLGAEDDRVELNERVEQMWPHAQSRGENDQHQANRCCKSRGKLQLRLNIKSSVHRVRHWRRHTYKCWVPEASLGVECRGNAVALRTLVLAVNRSREFRGACTFRIRKCPKCSFVSSTVVDK